VRADEIRFTASGRAAVRERLGIPEDAFVVGCVSRFHPKKRNDIVVEAVKALPGAHLILAGSGETEGELRALAASIAERVHFLPTPTSDVAEVYSAFDVSVFCPSPTEGAPRAVILAMFAERAVLSTGAEGVTELLEHGGWIVAPENDAEALAESLTRLRDDPAQRERLGIEGKQQVEQLHAAPMVAERLEVLLRDCLRRRAP
jgi:glycosyltransferase involved in cell wall biosynthesis